MYLEISDNALTNANTARTDIANYIAFYEYCSQGSNLLHN